MAKKKTVKTEAVVVLPLAADAPEVPAEAQDAPPIEATVPPDVQTFPAFHWAVLDGAMMLHEGMGYPGRIIIRFANGLYFPKDAMEYAALSFRAAERGDIQEVT